MADRWTSGFKILEGRQPVKRSPSGSILRAISGAVRTELEDVLTVVNNAYDGRLINTSDGLRLDAHGAKLVLPREAGESDTRYRTRLLTEFQTIPDGLTDIELYNAIFALTDPDVPVITQWYEYPWEWPSSLTGLDYFGLNTIGGNIIVLTSNSKVACKFTLADDALITGLSVYAAPRTMPGSVNIHAAIYADNAGAPDTRLAVSSNNPVIISDLDWHDFTFDTILTPGVYWLAINVNGGDLNIYSNTGVANQAGENVNIPPPSDPFGAVTTWNAYELSLYAGYTIIDPSFTWNKWLNTPQTRFTVSCVLANGYTSGELDAIEAAVTAIKPAHVMVRIVRDQTTYHELLREIL